MSDQSQGPGWWRASDGRWYPPHTHPDYRPPPPPPPPPPRGERQTVTIPVKARDDWWALAGAAMLVVGSFMKWATAGPFSVNGTDGDGWLTVAAGAAAAILCWKALYWQAALAAGVGGAIVIWKLADLSSLNEGTIFDVSPGAGLYVCGIGAAVCAVKSLWRWYLLR